MEKKEQKKQQIVPVELKTIDHHSFKRREKQLIK
jgi:hypothetical protein